MRSQLLAALALSSLLVVACKKDGESAAPPSPSSSARATGTPATGAPATAADPGSHGPPVVVRLSGTGDGTNEADLTVEIEVKAGIAVPAALKIVLPAGATSTGSPLGDSVDVTKPGLQKRQLHVKSPAPIVETSPIVVTLEARDLDAGTGFRAERQWPPHAEGASGPHGGPRPPGGRPSPSAAPPP